MSKPTFISQISLGNLIHIVILIATVAMGYALLDARSEANSVSISLVSSDLSDLDERVRDLEQSAARADERLVSIFNLLTSIDSRLERIERIER
jgi:hypothetical protein